MLRHVLNSPMVRKGSASLPAHLSRRRMLTAATSKKRALSKQQLSGQQPASSGAPAPAEPTSGAPAATTAPEGADTSSNAVPIILALAVAGAGGAYYMGLIPGTESLIGDSAKDKETAAGKEEVASAEKEEKEAESKQAQQTATPQEDDETESGEVSIVQDSNVSAAEPESSGNRVVKINFPAAGNRSEPPNVVVDHPAGGNRVLMEPSKGHEATVDTALQELEKELAAHSSRSLSEAHEELAKLYSLDMTDIDKLTTTQLKVRLVQMAKDLEERTKWEAVRLKEFLAMKEKETADEYLQIIKKQRVEYEDLMERRLRDQKDELSRQTTAALEEKDASLQAVVERYLKVQEEQFLEEKSEFEQKTEEQISAKYEELYGKSVAEAKDQLSGKLDQKVKQLEELSRKLAELEIALKTSKDFQSGSVQAHRMSAAALALVDRLETSKPAAAEVAALKAVSGSSSVVDSALGSLPSSSLGGGIPTLQELQTRFEESVLPKSRQAAMVPAGQHGLEGQLLGMVFSTLKYPPGPDDPAPESEKDASEFVLARARRHVQLGELEHAVEQLDKLEGQVAFTASDWKKLAKERVAVDKVLKVIRLECALANESMSKALADAK